MRDDRRNASDILDGRAYERDFHDIGWGVTISRKDSISQENTVPPTSKTRSRRVGTCGSSPAICSGGSVTVSLIEMEHR